MVLTPLEEKIVALVTEGLMNHEIGDRLGISEHVTKNYLKAIFDKVGCSNRVELALWWMKRREDEK